MVNNCKHLNQFRLPLIWSLGGNTAIGEGWCLDCDTHLVDFYPYGYWQLECPHGHTESYMRYVDNITMKDNSTCACGEPFYFLNSLKEVNEPGVIINWVEGELENANHHDKIHLVSKLYGKLINRFGHPLEIARILEEVFLG